jgi:hypothetical protein
MAATQRAQIRILDFKKLVGLFSHGLKMRGAQSKSLAFFAYYEAIRHACKNIGVAFLHYV